MTASFAERRYPLLVTIRRGVGTVACAALCALALARCSSVTELIIVIDSDLAPGADIDDIEISVDNGNGFVDTKRRAVLAAGDLPITLGVRAGSRPNAAVAVQATARRAGQLVTTAALRTSMVEGESKLVQVSLCRSCGAACEPREVPGATLPAWTGSSPSAPSCSGPGVDPTDGGLDAEPIDAPIDAPYVSPPLLAYWDFEEGSGTTVFDRSGANRNATITAADPAIVRGEGKYDRGVVFARRSGERLDCPDVMSSLINDGALSFWMRDDDDDPAPLASSASYFSNQNSTRSHLFVWREKTASPQSLEVAFQLADDGGAGVYAGKVPFDVTKSVWTRVVVSWSQTGARVLVGTSGTPATVTFPGKWAPNEQSCYFGSSAKVAFDDIKFFARTLTDAEMAAIP